MLLLLTPTWLALAITFILDLIKHAPSPSISQLYSITPSPKSMLACFQSIYFLASNVAHLCFILIPTLALLHRALSAIVDYCFLLSLLCLANRLIKVSILRLPGQSLSVLIIISTTQTPLDLSNRVPSPLTSASPTSGSLAFAPTGHHPFDPVFCAISRVCSHVSPTFWPCAPPLCLSPRPSCSVWMIHQVPIGQVACWLRDSPPSHLAHQDSPSTVL